MNRGRKSLFFGVLILVIIFSMSGCTKEYKESLLVAGSSTILPYISVLSGEFMKQNSGVYVVCDDGGSQAGLIAVKRGAIDIATMSYDMENEEDDEYTRSYLIARDGIAIIVNPSNKVTNMDLTQVKDVFSGKINNWKELGGMDSPITVITDSLDSQNRQKLENTVMDGDEISEKALVVKSGKEMTEAVVRESGSIGYIALKDMTGEIKSLSINGVEMNRLTILSGRYPLTRSFYYVLYRDPAGMAKKFLQFTISKKGQTLLEKEGLIRVY